MQGKLPTLVHNVNAPTAYTSWLMRNQYQSEATVETQKEVYQKKMLADIKPLSREALRSLHSVHSHSKLQRNPMKTNPEEVGHLQKRWSRSSSTPALEKAGGRKKLEPLPSSSTRNKVLAASILDGGIDNTEQKERKSNGRASHGGTRFEKANLSILTGRPCTENLEFKVLSPSKKFNRSLSSVQRRENLLSDPLQDLRRSKPFSLAVQSQEQLKNVRRLKEQLLPPEEFSNASQKTKTSVKDPTRSIHENEAFDALQFYRVSKDLNCPIDTTKDARSLFDRYATSARCDETRTFLDSQKFEEVVRHILRSTGQKLSEEAVQQKTQVCWSEADRNGNGNVDFEEFALWYSSWGFQRELLLSPHQILTREVAVQYNLSVPDVESLQAKFHLLDEDGSGLIEFCEFEKLLYQLMKVPRGQELPANRLEHFWKEIDIDGSGSVNFDEFLQWYIKYFDMKGTSNCSPPEQLYQSVRPNMRRRNTKERLQTNK